MPLHRGGTLLHPLGWGRLALHGAAAYGGHLAGRSQATDNPLTGAGLRALGTASLVNVINGIGANHGREQITACRLRREGGRLLAAPIRSKAGLITQLAGADGYFLIKRDCEGLPKGAQIQVYPY